MYDLMNLNHMINILQNKQTTLQNIRSRRILRRTAAEDILKRTNGLRRGINIILLGY